MASAALTDEGVRQLAVETFQDAPEQWRGPEIIVRAAQDFGGEDALYVTAVFPDGVQHLNGAQRADLQIALGDRLSERDDHRLVYLSALTRSDLKELRALEADVSGYRSRISATAVLTNRTEPCRVERSASAGSAFPETSGRAASGRL